MTLAEMSIEQTVRCNKKNTRICTPIRSLDVLNSMDTIFLFQSLPAGLSIEDFGCISKLLPNFSFPVTIGIDFNDTTQPVNFEIVCSLGMFK